MSNIWGIMQGRFTNGNGFYPQQFPWFNWKNEFYIAKKYHLDCLEWMFNAEHYQDNPLWTKEGRGEMKEVIRSSGVRVESVCLNYFMENNLRSVNSMGILKHVFEACSELNISRCILPLFGANEILDVKELTIVLEQINDLMKEYAICLGLETDISVQRQIEICSSLDSEKIGLCYDIGNAVGKGYDCLKDIEAIRDFLLEIHVKDKVYGGNSVMLGQGNADFKGIFERLRLRDRNVYILESYFGKEAVNDTLKNIRYVREASE